MTTLKSFKLRLEGLSKHGLSQVEINMDPYLNIRNMQMQILNMPFDLSKGMRKQ